MAIRLSGLASGMDTEAIIKELMSAQSIKKTKLENKKTKLEWKEDKWKELNTKLYNLYSGDLGKMRTQGTFLTKAVSSSDESKVTFSAGAKVPAGTHSIRISQVASAQYITGNRIQTETDDNTGKEKAISAGTKLTEVKFGNKGQSGYIPIGTVLKLRRGDHETSYFTIDEDTTISDISNWCKNNDVTFNYDEINKRFFISSSLSGKSNAFTLTSTTNIAEDVFRLSHMTESYETPDHVVHNYRDDITKAYQYLLYPSRGEYDTDEEVKKAESAAKKTVTAALKAADDAQTAVYKEYIKKEVIANGGTESMLRWDDQNKWSLECDDSDLKANIETALKTSEKNYDFETLIRTPAAVGPYDYQAFYNNTYRDNYKSNMDTLAKPESMVLMSLGRTAAQILGNIGADDFIKNQRASDPVYLMAGGKNAYSILSNEEKLTLADLIRQKNTLDLTNETAVNAYKDRVKQYAKAGYIAEKEAYKAYVTAEFKKINGAEANFKLTWNEDGSYLVEKTSKDTAFKLSDMRKQLREKSKGFNLEEQLAESPETVAAKTYKKVYMQVAGLGGAGTYDSEIQPNIKADQYMVKIDHSLNELLKESPSRALDLMGIGELGKTPYEGGKNTAGATLVAAQDLKCTYNGSEYVNDSNTLTVNGLTIHAIDVTTSTVKATVTNDTTKVYDAVKAFCKSYNEVLKELSTLYYAKPAKGYDILTDDQRKAMGEKSAEKWDNKIKESLLRRDTTMESIISTLRSITSKSVTVNGKDYDLTYFGVNTADYTEKGLLHIDGDKEDAKTSANEDRLTKALSEDPDLVMQVITKISGELYSKLTEKMGSTSLSSALTFYNDKEITSLKKSYEDSIKKMEKKLAEIETSYYRKFAAMEKAMAQMNNQNNSLASLLGGNG